MGADAEINGQPQNLYVDVRYTSNASRAAIRSMGRTKTKKKIESTKKPLAARVYSVSADSIGWLEVTHYNAVIRGEDGQFIQACNQVPACSDIPSDEDPYGKDRERVHV